MAWVSELNSTHSLTHAIDSMLKRNHDDSLA